MTKTKPAGNRNSPADRIIVIHGLDGAGKPRAAKFSPSQADPAANAAGLMNLKVHTGDLKALGAAAAKLSAGRIYSNGRGFVPRIRQDAYAQFLAAIGSSEPAGIATAAPHGLPSSWDAIEVGHLVLGQADAADEGWWETIVTHVDGDMLTLQVQDNPAMTIVRHRSAVALMKPDHG